MPVAAGALLLEAESLLGIVATLMLLTALVLAFRRRRAGPLAAAAEPACAGYAPLRFLLAAAGWLLTLLMLFGGHDWPALLAGIALGGPGRA